MSLWLDKYRPAKLSKLDFQQEQAARLKALAEGNDLPHLLFHGPAGSGKKTRIMCMLDEMFGPAIYKLKMQQIQCTTPSNKKIDLTTVSSAHHIEINPSDAGYYDRVVVQEVLKQAASIAQAAIGDESKTNKPFKVVIITDVDKLTKDAQHALRRTMEKHSATARLILCCRAPAKVIPAIQSRCLSIRVPAPSHAEIATILKRVYEKEEILVEPGFIQKLATASDGNLRKALLLAESSAAAVFTGGATTAGRPQPAKLKETSEIKLPEWEIYLAQTGRLIIQQQTPSQLLLIRARVYELLTHCIPPTMIIKGLLSEVEKLCDAEIRGEIIQAAAHYELRMQQGSKHIFHIEAFCAKAMAVIQKHFESAAMDVF